MTEASLKGATVFLTRSSGIITLVVEKKEHNPPDLPVKIELEMTVKGATELAGLLLNATRSEPTQGRPHIVDGQFQSDKYPTCPPGKVPLSVKDPMATDLLWQYAQRRRAVDEEFAADLEFALAREGYFGPGNMPLDDAEVLEYTFRETPSEIQAFIAGWNVRRVCGPLPSPVAKEMPWICNASQVDRVSFERGWAACNQVRRFLLASG